MKLRHLFLLLLLSVTGIVQAQMQMPAIPTDTAVRIGKLSNGLTYYIRHNNWPEHRANFYIAQKVGSIQEEESQRGLAHFLEHMAFNGSDHFKGNNLIEYLRSIGVEFGRDLNAYTSIDQTVYNIDNVPTNRQSSLDSCLLILRDWSTGLTLDEKEIQKERGVIHEEWRMRTSAQSRMFERNLPKLYPGSKYGVRYPIGLMSVVDHFKPKELRDYYKKWYHPSNQGIIVVGDIDVNHTEEMIKKLFGSIPNPQNALPIVDEPVPDNSTPIVVIDKDKEMKSNSIQIFFKHDIFPDSLKGTLANYINEYIKDAAVSMLNDRFTEEAQKADCPYVGAQAGDGEYIFSKTKDAFYLAAAPKEMEKTAASLKAIMVEARRAADFGFTPTEYKRYQENYLSSLDKMWEGRDKRSNTLFYNECKENFLNHEPISPIEFDYHTMKQIVPMIPIEAINEAMKKFVPANDSNMVIINFNTEKEGNVYPTEAGLLNAIKGARAEKLNAYVDNVKDEPLITHKPTPGKIIKEVRNDKFGYTTLTLSNGARVLLKQTDFKKDQVLLSGKGEGGSSLYGPKDYVNANVFDDVIGVSGLGDFSNTELSKALAGKIANADLSMGERNMRISGSSTPKDVETMLQMTYLYFTHINKDQQSFNNLMDQMKVSLKNRSLSPETALSDSLTATLYGHSPRMEPMTIDKLSQVNYDRILQMAKERTATAQGWTFTIIGNFDNDSIRPLICQYLAALPGKDKAVKGKRLDFIQKGMIENRFTRKMETPKANSYFIWTNDKMPYTLEKSIQANMAGQILSMVYLKKIREDASAAYSCGAQGSATLADDGYHQAMIIGYCPMKPEKKDIAIKIMEDEVPLLAKYVDKDMLSKVQATMVKNYDTALKTNGYWAGVINSYDQLGIDTHTDYVKLIQAQTPETIQSFMCEFLKVNNRISVIMLPASK